MNDDESRQLYLEYRSATEQLQKLQEYLDQTTENMGEVGNLVAALDEFGALTPGSALLAPIANGIFFDATLKDPSTVKMNVGAGVMVEKTIAEAKALLEKQRADLEALRSRALKDREQLVLRLKEIEQNVE